MSNPAEPAARSAVTRSAVTGVLLGAAALLIGLYFALVAILAPGGPFGDDLDIANSVETARAAADPWPALWARHNEHRLVTTKLAFWAQRALTGAPNYTLLALVGNLCLLAVFAVMARRAWTQTGPAAGAAVLFVAGMTFSYSSADSMLWAMAALSNYSVTAFALLAFWMLGQYRSDQGKPAAVGATWTAGALAMALLSAISQGNGLLALVLGTLFLLLQRRWISAASWALVAAAVIVAYMAGPASAAEQIDPLAWASQPIEAGLFALIVSGSALGYPLESETLRVALLVACGVLGAMLWAVVAFGFARERFQTRDPLLWFAVFLIGSGCLAALGRLDEGLIQAMVPRYHIHSCLLIACCVLVLAGGREGQGQAGGEVGGLAPRLRRFMPLLAVAAIAYVGVSTLTLWRMHVFYAEHVGGR